MAAIYRYRDALVPNSAAIGYALGGYALGVAMLCSHLAWVAAAGVVLLAHAMIFGAYLLHDAAHLAIFRSARANAHLGTAMAWLTGACYAPFSALRHKHMRHHVDRADIVTFDTKAFLIRLPAAVQRGADAGVAWPVAVPHPRREKPARDHGDGDRNDYHGNIAKHASNLASLAWL